MTQSAVDVANSALQKIGAASITSLTDGSAEARAVSIAYDSNRRDELRRYPWNFSIKRAVLAPDVETPTFGYDYQFTLPADCLRVMRCADATIDWQIEGRKILTNGGDTLYLRYQSDVTDEAQWDSNFYNVFAVSLAIDICDKLTQSNTKKQALQKEYNESIAFAKRSDSIEFGPIDAQDDYWWLVRL